MRPTLTLAWAAVVLAVLAMLLFAGSYSATTNAGSRLVAQAIAVGLLVSWLLAILRSPWWLPRRDLLLPGLVALAGMTVSGILAADVRLALGGVVVAALLFASLLVTERVSSHAFFRPRVRILLIALPGVLSAVYIAQVVVAWIGWWGVIGRIDVPPLRPDWASLTLGSPNLVAAVMVILAPMAIALALDVDRPGRRRMAGASLVGALALVAVLLTGSRSGVLGVLGAVVVGGALVVVLSRRIPRRALVPGLIAGVVLGGAAVAVLIARGGQGGEELRVELWRTALAIFASDPLTGGGADTWAALRFAEARPFVGTAVLQHPHDVYVWTLAEQGIIGTLGILVFVVSVIVGLARRAWSSDVAIARPAIGALAAIGGLAVQSLVDVLTNLPGIVVLLAVVTGYAWGRVRAPDPSAVPGWTTRLPRVAIAVTGVVVIVVLGAGFARANAAILAANGARASLVKGDAEAAVAGFTAARDLDPFPLYRNELAIAEAFAGDSDAARPLADEMLRLDGIAHNLIFDAYLRAEAGDRAGAVAAARLAMDRGWPDPGVMLNAARVGELAGDAALATDGLVQAAALAPTTLGDPYWTAPERALPYDQLIDQAATWARERFGEGAAIMVLGFGGRAADAADLAGDGSTLAAIVRSSEDPASAIAQLRSILAADPDDWTTAAWLSWIEEGAGDMEAAREHARWAATVQGDQAPGILNLPRRVGGDRDGPQSYLYGLYPISVYEQEGSGLLFGPGSVTLVP